MLPSDRGTDAVPRRETFSRMPGATSIDFRIRNPMSNLLIARRYRRKHDALDRGPSSAVRLERSLARPCEVGALPLVGVVISPGGSPLRECVSISES